MRDPGALAGERWVTFPPPRRGREPFATVLEQRLGAAGIEAAEIVRIDSLTAQKRFVDAGFGIALSSRAACRELRLGRSDHRRPRAPGSLPVTLVRRQNGYLSGAAQNLVAVIKAGAPKRAGRPRALRP